ncbi:hypothetical protein [Cellulomonas composti]|uniref:Uncharacterized protein n=1 Tax=Cellulomonas composti TaxID=266130 RepID=A0A511JDB1_9CELL|nr:hypothetical protein [Cellulomonas composti]GEL95964.1 hypothetical protein CCO02nite_26220 [Cellulomonas composti]
MSVGKRVVVVDDLGAKYRRIRAAADVLAADLTAQYGDESTVDVRVDRVESIAELLAIGVDDLRAVDIFLVDFELNTATYDSDEVDLVDVTTPPVLSAERRLRNDDAEALTADERDLLAELDSVRTTRQVRATTGVGVLLYLTQALGLPADRPTNRVFAYVDLGQPTGRLFAAAARAWFHVPTFPFQKDEQALSTRTIATRLKGAKGDDYQQAVVDEAARRLDALLAPIPTRSNELTWLVRPDGLDPHSWFRALLAAKGSAATAPYKRLGLVERSALPKRPNPTTQFHDLLVARLYDGMRSFATAYTGDDDLGRSPRPRDSWPPSLAQLRADETRSEAEYDRDRARGRLHDELEATRSFWDADDVDAALNDWHRAALALRSLLEGEDPGDDEVRAQNRRWRSRMSRSYEGR